MVKDDAYWDKVFKISGAIEQVFSEEELVSMTDKEALDFFNDVVSDIVG